MNLMQGETWTARDGRVLPIADMAPDHKAACVKMLMRQAALIERRYTMAEMARLSTLTPTVMGEIDGKPIIAPRRDWVDLLPRGQAAQDAFDRELQERWDNPERWLLSTPLVKALSAS